MLPRVVVVLLLAFPLAGCSDAGPAEEDPDGRNGDAAPAAVEAPAWAVGDWWMYDLSTVGAVTFVVTGDAGDAWTVDVDHADMAFWHAAFGQISTVGSIGKKHLDGSQEHGAVHFLDFPLQDNKTWGLTWDGIDFQATTRLDGERAHVTATADDGRVRTYTYDASVGWFRSMEARDANGTVEFAATFQRGGHGHTGEVVRWTVHDVHAFHMANGETLFEEFTVPDDATDVWYGVEAYCHPDGLEGDQGAYEVDVGSAARNYENGFGVQQLCPATVSETGTLEPDPGRWGVLGGSVGGTVDLVLVPRTETRFGAGAGAS